MASQVSWLTCKELKSHAFAFPAANEFLLAPTISYSVQINIDGKA